MSTVPPSSGSDNEIESKSDETDSTMNGENSTTRVGDEGMNICRYE